MPVRTASEAWRRRWTSRRASGPVSQCGAVRVRTAGGGASFPSTESAALSVTNGDAGLDEVGEGLVEVASLLFEDAEGDLDSGGAELFDALAADQWVGIAGGDDAAGDSGGDESVSAGAGAAVVAAGLESDVSGGAGGAVAKRAGLLECDDLGVVAVGVDVRAFSDDFSVANEDAAYLRVGRGERGGRGSKREGPLHEANVVWHLRLVLRMEVWTVRAYSSKESTKLSLSKGRISSIFSPIPA